MLISLFLMIIISTSLSVPTQPSPRFHVEAWLRFRNCEKDYSPYLSTQNKLFENENKANERVQSNLSEMKNKFLPTCLQVNYRDSLGEFSNKIMSYGMFRTERVKDPFT